MFSEETSGALLNVRARREDTVGSSVVMLIRMGKDARRMPMRRIFVQVLFTIDINKLYGRLNV